MDLRQIMPATITKGGSKITKIIDKANKENTIVCDYAKNNKLSKKIGLFRNIKTYDANTGKLKGIKVGLEYSDPLELGDFVILSGKPNQVLSQLKEACKMADDGCSPRTIVEYFQALKDKMGK